MEDTTIPNTTIIPNTTTILNTTTITNATLNTLISFVSEQIELFDTLEKDVLTLYQLDVTTLKFGGMFYLGGQLKLSPDDEITLEKIEEVRLMSKQREIEYGCFCNSFEAASLHNANKLLDQMEEIIKTYNYVMHKQLTTCCVNSVPK